MRHVDDVVLQDGNYECGLCCLAMLFSRLGLAVEAAAFHQEMSRPITATELLLAARRNNLHLIGIWAPSVSDLEPFVPCIIHWQGEHFVLLEAILEKGALIVDPRSGRRTAGANECASFFSGPALIPQRYEPLLDPTTVA